MVGFKLNIRANVDVPWMLNFMGSAYVWTFFAAGLGAVLLKKDAWRCADIAVALSARGGPGIVISMVAFQSGIINASAQLMLITLTLLSTLCASWWFEFRTKQVSSTYYDQI